MATPDPIQLLNQVNQNLVAAYQESEFDIAMNFAQQALKIIETNRLTDHPDVATSLNNLAGFYRAQGRYTEAEPLYQQALAMRRNLLGEAHPDVATSLNNLAGLYRAQGRYGDAEPLYRDALVMRRKLLGEAHPGVASSLNNLAGLYESQGRYEEAEPLYRDALVMLHNLLGEEHPYVASSLNNLAGLYESQGRYEEAEPLYRDALVMRRNLLGEVHPYVAQSLNNLAGLYESQGRYTEAEPLYQEALVMTRNLLGEVHPDIATFLNNLAGLHRAQGRYEEAEPLYRDALVMRRKLLGEAHPDVASSLNNLAGLYESQGRYEEAEPLYRDALVMMRKLLGEAHPDVATSLNNLAGLHRAQGRYEGAELLYRDALVMRRKLLGKAHPDVATSLNNLAGLYYVQGRYTEAEPLYQEALVMMRKLLGEAHPDVATSLNNLAELYRAQRRYEEAELLYRDALVMMRKLLGEVHPDVASSLNNLAGLYESQGRYTEAEPLYRDALVMRRKLLGEAHPDVATSLNNLAALNISHFMAKENNLELLNEALNCFCESTRVEVGLLAHADDEANLEYVLRNQTSFAALFSLVKRYLINDLAAHKKVLDVVLQRKNLTQEAEFFRTESLLSEDKNLLELYRSLRQQRAVLRSNKELNSQLSEVLDPQIQKLDKEITDLRERIPAVGLQQRLRQAERSAIALIMPPDATLLEFVRFQMRDFATNSWQDYQYAVFIMPKVQPEQAKLIFLNEPAASIDTLIEGFRNQVQKTNWDIRLDLSASSIEEALNSPSEEVPIAPDFTLALCEKVLAPLLPHLQSKHLIIAGDGGFNFLPFDTLTTEDGQYLCDKFQISYLGCGRDLLRWQAPELDQAQLSQPLILGDPDHELSGFSTTNSSPTPALNDFNEAIQPLLETQGTREGIAPLPGAGIEVQRIAQLLGVTPYVREQAVKARIEQAKSPVAAHFALHASYQPQKQLGLDSFLVLAGAGSYRKRLPLPPEAGNGILTAMECSHLSLLGTEIVGLSACLTGLGLSLTGEGVLGLRRAFILTGVRSVISTLWPIHDISTPILMDAFYKQILAGVSRLDALRHAQAHLQTIAVKELRAEWLTAENIQEMVQRQPALDKSLKAVLNMPDDHCPYQHPYYWAGFLLHGETGPLTPKALKQLRSKQY